MHMHGRLEHPFKGHLYANMLPKYAKICCAWHVSANGLRLPRDPEYSVLKMLSLPLIDVLRLPRDLSY